MQSFSVFYAACLNGPLKDQTLMSISSQKKIENNQNLKKHWSKVVNIKTTTTTIAVYNLQISTFLNLNCNMFRLY